MQINPTGPNSRQAVDAFMNASHTVADNAFGRLGKLTVKDVLGGNILDRQLEKGLGKDTSILLSELITNLDMPILKGLVQETIATVANWFEDPEVLCCLLQGIWAMYASAYSNTELAKFQREGISISESGFAKWLDVSIAFVDLIITFMSSDVKKLSIMLPDFIKEIMDGVISAILITLHEVLFTVRDSAINSILSAIDRAQDISLNSKNIWANCLPFSRLLEIQKRHVHDYGLFASLFEKIKGFISGKVSEFGYMKSLNMPKTISDLEFMYWYRDLLIKLKTASINFELCVNYGAQSTTGSTDTDPDPVDVIDIRDVEGKANSSDIEKIQGIKVAADGTILQDKDQQNNSIPLLNNSSIRTFLNKYYGYPLDLVDNILTGSTSGDSIQGSNINSPNISNINADCPNSPSPQDIVRWALRIRNRNL